MWGTFTQTESDWQHAEPQKDDCSVDGKSACSSAPRRHVQSLLWSDLLALIKPPEQPVVRAVIGSSLIEENELLFQEADALEEILQGIEAETQHRLSSHRLFDTPARLLLEREIQVLLQSCSRVPAELQGAGTASQGVVAAGSSASCAQPVQPAQRSASARSVPRETAQPEHGRAVTRDNSRKSINRSPMSTRLVETPDLGKLDLRDCQAAEALDPAKAGRLVDSPVDKRVVSYIIGKSVLQDRAKSLDSWTSRTNSSRSLSSDPSSSNNEVPRSRASSALSTAPCNSAMVVDCLKPYLNCYDIDVVADKIRHALASERAVLLEDVTYLRDCLERSTELYSCVANPDVRCCERFILLLRHDLGITLPVALVVKNAPPSLGELRDCGKSLERRLHSEMQLDKMNKVPGTRVGRPSMHVMQQEPDGLKSRTVDVKNPLPKLSIPSKPDIPLPGLRKDSLQLSFRRGGLGATGSLRTQREPISKKEAFRSSNSCGHIS